MESGNGLKEIMEKCNPIIEKGMEEKLSAEETAEVLSIMLFETTRKLDQKLVEVRDFEAIKEKGAFKYAGLVENMCEEGILPKPVLEKFLAAGLDRHIGPSYLRVKGLLTHKKPRKFFAKQLAFTIKEELDKSQVKKEGFVLFLPNMTGGAWIGDETMRQAEKIFEREIWPAVPYMRNMRKVTEVIAKESIVDYIEGILPKASETTAIINFEELRTTAETTTNAVQILRKSGYDGDGSIKITAASVFDYRHLVGVERLNRLGIAGLYLVDGMTFFKKSKELGYINEAQFSSASEWLQDPWQYSEKTLSALTALVEGKNA